MADVMTFKRITEDQDVTPAPPFTAAGRRQRELDAVRMAKEKTDAENAAARKAGKDVEGGAEPAPDAVRRRGDVANRV